MAQFPSREIAQRSYDFRTLGLGYANIGGLLMNMGLGYDSPEGRALCGALSAIMTGVAYATSAEMAGELGAFPRHAANAEAMLRVIRNHRAAAHGLAYEGLNVPAVALDAANCPDQRLVALARSAWDEALSLGQAHGFRNAQTTVIAPTGTIGLVMDCDTTGIEPDFALVKFKKLAGGGYFKIINQSVPAALRALGYGEAEIGEIVAHAVGHASLGNCPGINPTSLAGHGFGPAELDKLASALIDLDKQIPPEIAWVLRVDGHTDVRPIASPQFRSNWELSSARAISVVQYLISLGVPAQRLVAAGFAEFQPLDPEKTEDAYRRNRRIELKLTER